MSQDSFARNYKKKKTFTQEEINKEQEYGREQSKDLSKTKKKNEMQK